MSFFLKVPVHFRFGHVSHQIVGGGVHREWGDGHLRVQLVLVLLGRMWSLAYVWGRHVPEAFKRTEWPFVIPSEWMLWHQHLCLCHFDPKHCHNQPPVSMLFINHNKLLKTFFLPIMLHCHIPAQESKLFDCQMTFHFWLKSCNLSCTNLFPKVNCFIFICILLLSDWSQRLVLSDKCSNWAVLQQKPARCYGILHGKVHLQTGLLQ